jgi:hypothetical protein
MPFRFRGLPIGPFESLIGLSDDELSAKGMRRMVADEKPGFPCRVSLEDAEPGERLLLLPFEHQPAHSPYRAAGPIFVREIAKTTFDRTDELPPVLVGRMLSVRAYDTQGSMVDADVVDGAAVDPLLKRLFGRADTDYVHIHFARRGCYACRVARA